MEERNKENNAGIKTQMTTRKMITNNTYRYLYWYVTNQETMKNEKSKKKTEQ